MKRRLFHSFAALSLGMALAVLALWLRSTWVGDAVEYLGDVKRDSDHYSYLAAGAYSDVGCCALSVRRVNVTPVPENLELGLWSGWRRTAVRYAMLPPGNRPIASAERSLLRFELDVLRDDDNHDDNHDDDHDGQNAAGRMTGVYLACPHWFIAALLLVFPAMWYRRRRRVLRRHARGHCTACGYNLTGNVSGVCPECGKTIAREPPT